MMKKLGCLMVATLALSNVSEATENKNFSGVEFGAAVGFSPSLTNQNKKVKSVSKNKNTQTKEASAVRNTVSTGEKVTNFQISKKSKTGFFGKVFLGYMHQFDSGLVLGLSANLGFGGAKFKQYISKTVDNSDTDGPVPCHQNKTLTSRFFVSELVKIGYAMDRVLPFIVVGAAQHKMKAKSTVSFNGKEAEIRKSGFSPAFVIGGGVQYALSSRVSMIMDYQYHRISLNKKVQKALAFNKKAGAHYVSIGMAYNFPVVKSSSVR